MRPEHEIKLEALAEKLADVFLVEADPEAWNGAGVLPKEQTKETRGDRQWDLKNANQLGLLFARALELQARARWARVAAENGDVDSLPAGGSLGAPIDPDAEIRKFEAEASRVLERLGRR